MYFLTHSAAERVWKTPVAVHTLVLQSWLLIPFSIKKREGSFGAVIHSRTWAGKQKMTLEHLEMSEGKKCSKGTGREK
jgi:hypothetical protein